MEFMRQQTLLQQEAQKAKELLKLQEEANKKAQDFIQQQAEEHRQAQAALSREYAEATQTGFRGTYPGYGCEVRSSEAVRTYSETRPLWWSPTSGGIPTLKEVSW
jgi:uncharacterized ferredoxin-like protein